jgi:hypothetical protein
MMKHLVIAATAVGNTDRDGASGSGQFTLLDHLAGKWRLQRHAGQASHDA